MSGDLILATFTPNEKRPKRLNGRVILDPLGRRKIVFIKGRSWSHESGMSVRSGELWRCYVHRDSKPEEKHKGVLVVDPLQKIDGDLTEPIVDLKKRSLPLPSGARARLSKVAKAILVEDPALAPFIRSAVANLDLPTDGGGNERRIEHVEFEEPVGRRLVFPAPSIGYAEKTSFAYLGETGHPVRVTLNQTPEPTNQLAFKLKRCFGKGKAIQSQVWGILKISAHDIPFPKPHDAQDEHFWSICSDFWCANAYAYDPNVMSPIIISSWKEVSGPPPTQEQVEAAQTLH